MIVSYSNPEAALFKKMNELISAGKSLVQIVEGINGTMEHGTWRDDKGMRLKDTDVWASFYVEIKGVETMICYLASDVISRETS